MLLRRLSFIKENRVAIVAASFFGVALIIISKLDHNPFCGDESCYGYDAIDLYYSLRAGFSEWLLKMLHVSPEKPPAIVWIGQLFVPIGLFVGNLDKAFIFSSLLLILISTALIYISLKKLCDGEKYCGLLGMLFIMSSPMLLTSSFTYLTEPFQLFSVVLFILLMAYREFINPILKTFLLIGLIALAFLSKINTIAFCLAPSIIIALSILKGFFFEKKHLKLSYWNYCQIVSFALIFIATTAWYYYNYQTVIAHLKLAYAGDVAAVWGVKASFTETLAYWFRVAASELMLHTTAILLIIFMLIGIISRLVKGVGKITSFDIILIASLVQIVFVGILFGIASNRVTRYLIPVLPYFSILLAWSFRWTPLSLRVGVIAYFLVAITVEYLIVSGHHLSHWDESIPVRKISNHSSNIEFINKILEKTKCMESSSSSGCVVAIDPLFRGDWLAPAPLNYYGYCKYFGKNKTVYYYSGNNFFGSSAEDAIKFLQSDTVNSVIICDPYIYKPETNYINISLKGSDIYKLENFLKTSPIYCFKGCIGDDDGIKLFAKSMIQSDSPKK